MGLLSGILGNASEVTIEKATMEYGQLLARMEVFTHAYKLVRDMILFTDKRLILVDHQGITGRKVEYHSIPYSKITQFSIETVGSFDLDAELKIWLSGLDEPIVKQFNRAVNIYEVQSILADHILF